MNMKKLILSVAGAFGLSAVSFGANYGLFVGINAYTNPGCSQLAGCDIDAFGMRDMCVNYGDWTADGATVLIDFEASRVGIKAALADIADKAVAGDTVLYYHSGHGGQDQDNDVHLCASDENYTDMELAEDLAKFRSGVKLVVFVDACNSGGLFKGARQPAEAGFKLAARVTKLMRNRRTVQNVKGETGITADEIGWITAADSNETTPFWYDGSPFTQKAIEGLIHGGADKDDDGSVTFFELYEYAKTVADEIGNHAQGHNDSMLKSTVAGAVPDLMLMYDADGVVTNFVGAVPAEFVIPPDATAIGEDVFSGCPTLVSLVVPETVKRIGARAFCKCKKLTSVTFGRREATQCGSAAFGRTPYNEALPFELQIVDGELIGYVGPCPEEVVIPSTVSNIAASAFDADYNDTAALSRVRIPASVAAIEECAFYECENLKTAEFLGDINAVEIAESAFYGTGIFMLQIKNGVLIGFIGSCPEKLVIPDDVRVIGCSAFDGDLYDVEKLVSVTIPDSVTEIEDYAFNCCDNLAEVLGADGVTSIGEDAFADDPFLYGEEDPMTGMVPFEIVYIGRIAYAVRGEDSLWQAYDDSEDPYSGFHRWDYELQLREDTIAIQDWAFCELPITAVTIPDTCRKIGASAFENCCWLKSLNLGNGVEEIGESAFACAGCEQVPSYYWEELDGYLEKLEEGVAINRKRDWVPPTRDDLCIVSLTLPSSIKSIGYGAFSELGFLSYVNGLRTAVKLGRWSEVWVDDESGEECEDYGYYPYVFDNTPYAEMNSDLYPFVEKGVVVGSEWIDAKFDDSWLENRQLTVPEGITAIGEGAFAWGEGFFKLNLPASLAEIDECAFSCCEELKYVEGIAGVKTVADNAFECTPYEDGWDALKLVIENNVVVGYDWDEGHSDGAVVDGVLTIPEGVTEIAEEALCDLDELVETLVLPASLKKIGEYAFAGNYDLYTIEGGDNVVEVGCEAFADTLFREGIEDPETCLVPFEVLYVGKVAYGVRGADSLWEDYELVWDDVIENNWNYELKLRDGITVIAAEAFRELPITKVVIPDSCMKIEPYAFECCYLFKSLDLGNGVREIGEYAFAEAGCSAVPERYWDEYYWYRSDYGWSVAKLPPKDAADCIVSLKLPASVEAIGNGAFESVGFLCYVDGLNTGIKLGRSSETWEEEDGQVYEDCWYDPYVFDNTPYAEMNYSLYPFVENGVVIGREWIGASFDDDWVKDGVLTIPEGITAVAEEAFCDSEEISTLVLPSSLKTIGEYGFAWNYGLKYVNGLTSAVAVGEGAFEDTPYLDGWDALKLVIENNVVVGYDWLEAQHDDIDLRDHVLTIPEGVTRIEEEALCGLDAGLRKVILPASLKTIGEYAFAENYELFTIEGGDGLVDIGYDAFEDTAFRYGVEDPETGWVPFEVIYVGKLAYGVRGADSLYEDFENSWDDVKEIYNWSYELPLREDTAAICAEAFHELPITKVTIPDSCKRIGAYAFECCDQLKSLDLGNGVESIGECAFSCAGGAAVPEWYWEKYTWETDDGKLISAKLPAPDTAECLVSLKLPESVQEIGCGAFSDFGFLCYVEGLRTDIAIGRYVEIWEEDDGQVYEDCWYEPFIFDCTPYTSMNWSLYPFVYKGAVLGCEMIGAKFDDPWLVDGTLTIPEGIAELRDDAFSNCEDLKSVVFETVDIVASSSAFAEYTYDSEKGITSVRLMPSITSMTMGDGDGYEFGGWRVSIGEYTGADKAKTGDYSDWRKAFDASYYKDEHFFAYDVAPLLKPHNYQISFRRVEQARGEMKTLDCEYGKEYALPKCGFERRGYTFGGWMTSEGGEVVYADQASVKNLAAEEGAVVELYANWVPNTYKVVFSANGGEGVMPDLELVYDAEEQTVLPDSTMTLKRYEFAGWSTTVNGDIEFLDGELVWNLTDENHGIVKLYAVWERTQVTDIDVKVDEKTGEITVVNGDTGESERGAINVSRGETAPFKEAAVIYDGSVLGIKDGSIKGTVQLKIAKGKEDKAGVFAGKVTATVQLSDGSKKLSFKNGTADESGVITPMDSGTWKLIPVVGVNGLAGILRNGQEEYRIDGARNLFSAKSAGDKQQAAKALSNYQGIYNLVWGGNYLTLTVGSKGKVKIAGVIDDIKVSTTSQMLIGEEANSIPVVITKKVQFSCSVWLAPDGVSVGGLGDYYVIGKAGTLRKGAKFAIDGAALYQKLGGESKLGETDLAQYLPDGLAVAQEGTKWTVAKAGKVALNKAKDGVDEAKLLGNPSALKLTYAAKTGAFKGSFKAYTLVKGKLKAITVNVTGVMVNGIGYGTASVKKAGSVPVTIE